MDERRYAPERGKPEDFYAQEVSKHMAAYFEKFRKGQVDKETVHKELKDGIEAALQAIEALSQTV